MDKKEIQTQQNQSLSTQQQNEFEVGKIIYQVNQLSPFKVSDEELDDWVISIMEICPNLEMDDLKHLIRCFKIAEEHYDNKLGIQNIFIGLRNRFGDKYIKSNVVI